MGSLKIINAIYDMMQTLYGQIISLNLFGKPAKFVFLINPNDILSIFDANIEIIIYSYNIF